METIGKRIAAARADVAYLKKDGFNKHFKYPFVTEAAVKREVGGVLAKHGLYIASVCVVPACFPPTAHQSQFMVVADVSVVIACIDDPTQKVEYNGIGQGADSGDKAAMKAMAAGLKYALTSGFLIETGDAEPEDDAKGDASASATDMEKAMLQIRDAGSSKELMSLVSSLGKLRGVVSTDEYLQLQAEFGGRKKALESEEKKP